MMHQIKILPVIVLLTLMMMACSKTQSVTKENLAQSYSSSNVKLNLQYKVFHPSQNQSVVYLQIPSTDLKYTASEETGFLEATAVIDLKVYRQDSEKGKAIDSALVKVSDTGAMQAQFNINTKVEINLPDNNIYVAHLKIHDINGLLKEETNFIIDKSDPNNRQNFLLFDDEYDIPNYQGWVNEPSWLRIKNNEAKPMQVRYYLRKFPLAPPPFSNFNPPPFQYEADSTFELSASGDFSNFKAQKMGFYHVLKDSNQKTGFTIFAFEEHFPRVVTANQMFESVRYLTTEWEYREMKQSKDIKNQLETFWVNCAGNKDKAKELISIYYGRVEEANRFFTSYVEGWKTDRGLIHIVYGKPNIIYRNPTSETWIYGEDKNMMSLSFTFIKVINPFTDNDFRLSRDENYKSSWYRSIESWRNGRIYAN
jgi:GWxTD domain-containing protein